MANCAYAANNCRAVTAATSIWRRRSLAGGQGAVVVAVVAVRVMEMAGHPVIHMIAVRHRFMAAPWPMDVPASCPPQRWSEVQVSGFSRDTSITCSST